MDSKSSSVHSLQTIVFVKLFATFALRFEISYAEIAQLVEHNLAKVRVASSSLVFRSRVWLSYLIIRWGSFLSNRVSTSIENLSLLLAQ